MNSCILMAEIIQEPQLRFTADNLEVTEMLVQFPALRENEPPATLKVVGWGTMASYIQQNYHQGDRVLLEGRLGMNTIDRPEGFKEKRAELTVQKIHALGTGTETTSPSVAKTPSTDTSRPDSSLPFNKAHSSGLRSQPSEVESPVASSQKNANYDSPLATPNSVGVLPQEDLDEQPIPQSTFKRAASPVIREEPDPDDIPF